MEHRRFRGARVMFVLATCAYVVVQLVVVAAWPVPYRFLDHTISDLGFTTCTVQQRPAGVLETCSPRYALFNIGSAVGLVLLAAAAIGLRAAIESHWARYVYIGLWIVCAASAVAVSAVPGDVDLGLHVLVALPQFFGQLAVLPLTAWAMRNRAPRFAAAAAVAAAVTAVGFVAFCFAVIGYGPIGLTERLALESVFGWALAAAVFGPGRRRALTEACRKHNEYKKPAISQ
ncbi:DUF998 domain-containing protein [Nocardia sp. CDC159]|uniref:DUF998 domain-containing protein n=1 Tax=Nocardia pulmonis TaxID=2951408 RepID=A0A9X2EHH4_9NOCA|nr:MULTISPECIES: DUF998 domain-containing protein [Nocardia]MCM6778333.1 DUF998 domain-containing protein [Nocardia pulmonis]MCM6791271.1 DUF998 domain-containing protein [Nocardia sp. CDC159]